MFQSLKTHIPRLLNSWFPILAIIFSFYSIALIFRASFLVDGERYFVLFDDEMISMRYGWNLAHGYGLVWNSQGQPVEGITNLLWALYMAFIHLFPLPLSKTSLMIQLTSFLLLLTNIYIVKKIAKKLFPHSVFVQFFSVFLTAFYFPLNSWGTILGTETSLIALCLSLLVLALLQAFEKKKIPLYFYIILFMLPFVRLDAFVPAFSIFLYSIFMKLHNKKKHIGISMAIVTASFGIQEGFRWVYYGNLFPNTYYLKMTGYPVLLRISRGAYVAAQFLAVWYILLPFFLIIIKPQRKYFLLIIPFIATIFYSIYVGGDAWEFFGGANRYITPAMPLFFILLIASLYELHLLLKNRIRMKYGYLVVTLIIITSITISLNAANKNMFAQWLLLRPSRISGENTFHVFMAKKVALLTKKDAVVAVAWAGVIPYFTNRTYIDLLGKNDIYIARKNIEISANSIENYIAYWPGHTKWDSEYSLSKKPDMFAQVYPPEEMRVLVKKDYTKIFIEGMEFYFRKDSQLLEPAVIQKLTQH